MSTSKSAIQFNKLIGSIVIAAVVIHSISYILHIDSCLYIETDRLPSATCSPNIFSIDNILLFAFTQSFRSTQFWRCRQQFILCQSSGPYRLKGFLWTNFSTYSWRNEVQCRYEIWVSGKQLWVKNCHYYCFHRTIISSRISPCVCMKLLQKLYM